MTWCKLSGLKSYQKCVCVQFVVATIVARLGSFPPICHTVCLTGYIKKKNSLGQVVKICCNFLIFLSFFSLAIRLHYFLRGRMTTWPVWLKVWTWGGGGEMGWRRVAKILHQNDSREGNRFKIWRQGKIRKKSCLFDWKQTPIDSWLIIGERRT